jgi:ATP-dependent helicase/nuclease subunit B
VTKLDRLQADPFAFYADAILGLLSWDIVDADPDSRWRGNAVHAVFEAWMKEDACDPAKLAPRARALLQASSAHPIMRAFWEPRLMEAIDWVADTMRALASDGRKPVAAEIFGETKVGEITLYGKVDRIDQLADGSLAHIHNKTGKPPSAKQVEAGYSMQLGLLGLIAARDGFPAVRGQPSRFEYWSLASYRGKLGYVSSPVGDKKIPPEDFIPLAAATLTAAIEKWLLGDAAFTAKLHPELAPYPDYDQLMRLDEWYGRSDG